MDCLHHTIRKLLLLVVPGIGLALTGCDPREPIDPELQRSKERGAVLFAEHCQRCHPRTGRGDYLLKIPATLLVRHSERELQEWIRGVDRHNAMPSFEKLEQQQLTALSDYLYGEVHR